MWFCILFFNFGSKTLWIVCVHCFGKSQNKNNVKCVNFVVSIPTKTEKNATNNMFHNEVYSYPSNYRTKHLFHSSNALHLLGSFFYWPNRMWTQIRANTFEWLTTILLVKFILLVSHEISNTTDNEKKDQSEKESLFCFAAHMTQRDQTQQIPMRCFRVHTKWL